jgi:hypothetical protein
LDEDQSVLTTRIAREANIEFFDVRRQDAEEGAYVAIEN